MTSTSAPPVGVVVLTQGRRRAELDRALRSVLDQREVVVDVVCVGNGWVPTDLPPGVRSVALPENLGIPAGRNAGVPHVTGDYLLFLDDDARLLDDDFLASAVELLIADPDLGILQPRVVASDSSVSPTRWIPRMRKGSPSESSPVFSLWEGALVARRTAFERAGGWGDEYFYAHEGIELAWRIWDAGYTVWYVGDLRCEHPAIDPARHAFYYRLNARNRVWVARRNLRWPLTWIYVLTWTGVWVLRSARSRAGLRTLRPWSAGWLEGWRTDPGDRRPMAWSTVWTMTRLGRPPVV